MRRVLITGMSGVGKSSALTALEQRGFSVLDTDEPGWTSWSDTAGGFVWDEDRILALLDRDPRVPQFMSGAVSNQGRFYGYFDAVVLLSAPAAVLLERIARRATNDFGKVEPQRAQVLRDLAEVEPLMRRTCTSEIDTTQPLDNVVDQLAQLIDETPR
jgi:dephospho-CoA kinase